MSTEIAAPVLERKPKPPGRGALKALAVVMAVLSFVGLITSGVVLVILAYLANSDSWQVKNDQAIEQRYKDQTVRARAPQILGRMLLEDSLRRVDPQPFLARPPLATLGVSFGLRLVSYLALIIGAIMTFFSSPQGPRLMLVAAMVLVLHGLVEALSILCSGNTLATEFYRDLQCQYLHVIEVAKIDGDLRIPFGNFRRVEPRVLKLMTLAYFVATTLLWQVAAMVLALCRPLNQLPASMPKSEKVA